ncbi:hypothetical protein GCM10010172_49380 [Paractinoplanes ferrugineus]|uniref:DUF7919 domain-containing protein n=1 Tax=Paractinoplanes ferrugineus TaxID=113564 RepID=A0A919JA78_9ACTN|nr:hypothetical protein [Actinoplanes ferrugineus]GIE16117.1 hypothetical protein Afe05nite_79570 [Actinoplanes ferrugineus]
MTEFADLSPYTYLGSGRAMRNVGWLGPDSGFPAGPVDDVVLEQLARWAREPANLTRGRHGCEFCPGPVAALGNGEIHVTGADGTTYAAPTLLVHYIEVHGYRPPDEFLAAVRHAATG